MPHPHLHKNPYLLEKIFDALNELVCVFDLEFRFVYINQASSKILGYAPEELIGRHFKELIIAEDLEDSVQSSISAYNGAQISSYENRYRHKDGRVVTLFWEGGWHRDNDLLICTARDITERQRLEKLEQTYRAQLEISKLQLEQLLERITDGFIALDDQAKVVYINQAACQIADIPREEIMSRVIWEVLPESSAILVREFYHQAVRQKTPYHVAYQSPRLHRWLEANAYPSGSGLSVFFRDITQQKELQEELDRAKDLQQHRIARAVIKATESERTQIGRELHDNVNQVLTTVKLYTELCREGIGNTEELLIRSGRLLQDAIDELRNLSRRLVSPGLGNISLQESIQELIGNIRTAVKFDIDLEMDPQTLNLSQEVHTVIYRIIQEQFTNIIKHAQASQVRFLLEVKERSAEIVLSDNGVGFDPSAQRKGIGIDNMNSRAESVGGSVWIYSEPGKGCMLRMSMPIN